MKANDFEFDGKKLSDYGFIMCHFDDKGLNTVSNGSKITFNTVSALNGSKHYLTSTEYEECLSATIQICKTPCYGDVMEISSVELRNITRWLSRKKFLKFKILDENYIDLYFEASFNISRIELDGKLVGLELEVVTNRPFALKEPKTFTFENTVESGVLERFCAWEKCEPVIETLANDSVISYGFMSLGEMVYTDIEYADEITVSDDKEIVLVNPTTISGSQSNLEGVIEGKYIYSSYAKKYYRISSGALYGIKTDSSSTSLSTYISMFSGVYELSVGRGKFVDEVYSKEDNTYPTDGVIDGCYYYYIGKRFVQNKKTSMNDISYEDGYIYPYTEITIVEDGDLNINNSIENRDTFIANCVAGEIITMDYPVIQSSISSHKIPNDFNWNFLRIANTFDDSRNDLTVSLPCIIKIKYSPIVKVGL